MPWQPFPRLGPMSITFQKAVGSKRCRAGGCTVEYILRTDAQYDNAEVKILSKAGRTTVVPFVRTMGLTFG